jgi:oligosaccharide reducing-end xylanase
MSSSLFEKYNRGRHPFLKMADVIAMVLAVTAISSRAGTVAAPYQIGTWAGFRSAAVSYTFDDDLTNQYSKAVPMFNAKGFKLTLFTVTKWLPNGSWAPLLAAASAGHEIASHTVTHPHLNTISEMDVSNELVNSQIIINSNVPGQKCLTIAYPFCNLPPDQSVVASHYIAGRGCSGQLVPATPPNFMNISSFVCGSLGLSGSAMMAKADAAAAGNSWCVYLIHAIDDENGYSPLPRAELQATVNYMSGNPDKFWVETFGNIVRYIRERNAASIAEISGNDNRITVRVTDDLDDSIYNYPITLRRPLPMGWTGASVMRSGVAVSSQVTNINSTTYLMFDVVPNGGDVIISKLPR